MSLFFFHVVTQTGVYLKMCQFLCQQCCLQLVSKGMIQAMSIHWCLYHNEPFFFCSSLKKLLLCFPPKGAMWLKHLFFFLACFPLFVSSAVMTWLVRQWSLSSHFTLGCIRDNRDNTCWLFRHHSSFLTTAAVMWHVFCFTWLLRCCSCVMASTHLMWGRCPLDNIRRVLMRGSYCTPTLLPWCDHGDFWGATPMLWPALILCEVAIPLTQSGEYLWGGLIVHPLCCLGVIMVISEVPLLCYGQHSSCVR